MPSVFSMIHDGDIPGRFVWQDDVCFVILTINPITPGHALVIPNDEVDHWIDLPPATLARCHEVAMHVGRAIDAAWEYERVTSVIAGFEVPHTHIHVIGANSMADMSFARAEQDPDPGRMDADAEKIRAALRAAGHGEHVPDA